MSVNRISPEVLWWAPHQQQRLMNSRNSAPNYPESIVFANHYQNHNDDEDGRAGEREVNIHKRSGSQQQQQQQQQAGLMFEKTLTPSDVGKLNRLVIPKQHAERHFPLNTSHGTDSGGMILSFEDEDGKLWRFRYSYWNSSQSYVLTKGWSRYVKEKRLDNGDVVLFNRHPTDPDRLFIHWRRGHEARTSAVGSEERFPAHHHHQAYPAHQYRPDEEASGAASGLNRSRLFNGSSSSRTLRLFGVDVEYQLENDQIEAAATSGS